MSVGLPHPRSIAIVFAALLLAANACGDSSTPDAVPQATNTAPTAASPLMTSDELCELLPTAEIGALMNAEARVTTFGGGPGTICDVGIAWTGTSLHVIVELLNNGGDAGFDDAVASQSSIFNVDPIDVGGIGDRAADFGGTIIFSSGQSVFRIGGFPEEVVDPELEEIGSLIATGQ